MSRASAIKDRVTVVIPTNRIDHWLDESVQSVLASPEVPQICVAFDGVVPPDGISWLSHPHVEWVRSLRPLGLPGVLNLALESISTEFVARLDADDRALPHRWSTQLDYLDAHPSTVLVASAAHRIDESGLRNGLLKRPDSSDARAILLGRNLVLHPSAMFRRESLAAVGNYDDRLRSMEDYEAWLRLGQLGQIAISSEPLIEYRVHGGQMSRGAAPWGTHIRQIQRAHRKLARVVGMSRAAACVRRTAWLGAQYARYWGVRTPAFDRTTP